MTDFLRLVVDIVALLFPFRLVHQWERGLYYLFGHCLATVGPGCYFVVPWFSEVRTVSMVPSVHQTPVQTVGTVSFSASLVLRVTDPFLAYNTLEKYEESAVELAGAVLSESVRNGTSLEVAQAAINTELAPHGLAVDRLRFLNRTEAPTVRLLGSLEGFTKT